MAEKSKREKTKEQKLKEDNIRKLDEQIKLSKKISKEYKKKMNKQLILNIVTVIIMGIYLTSINVLALYMETPTYLKTLKVLSILLAVVAIVYFELSYRKDNEKLFLYGVEVLALAVVTLFSNYAYYLYFETFNEILTGITIAFIVYYIIKILIVRAKMKKQYYKEQNDIKEIVKK